MSRTSTIHPTAVVSDESHIGSNTRIWHGAQVRERARIGSNCILGKDVYVDFDVTIGNNVKVQNNCSLYHPLVVDDGVFIGPHVVFTNDRRPRAINPDGSLKSDADWDAQGTRVGYGAALGAGAIVLPGITIGPWAMVGAGAVVTRDVPERGIVVGNPARLVGHACDCGARLEAGPHGFHCASCGRTYPLPSVENVV